MATTPSYPIADVRTPAELGHFNHPMPAVTLAVKRLLENEEVREVARLLPALSYVTGFNTITLSMIVHIGGGALSDKYTNAEKVIKELCGQSPAAGQTASLDYDLHTNLIKWRQLLIEVHMRAKVMHEQEIKTRSVESSEVEPLSAFKGVWGFTPDPKEYCAGVFAKCIDQMGLSYSTDAKTDWRRAKPASGRVGSEQTTDKAIAALPSKAILSTAGDARDAFLRKQMTIVLMTGMADITTSGFTSGGHGTTNDGVTRWVTYEDMRAIAKATEGMEKLPLSTACEILDGAEEELNLYTKPPMLFSLSNAYYAIMSNLRTRIQCAPKATKPKPGKERRPKPNKPRGEADETRDGPKPKIKKGPKGRKGKRAKGGDTTKEKEEEVEHVKGKRYEGGNPLGPPCRKFAAGNCKGPCKFSHCVECDEESGEEEKDLEDIDE